MILEVDVDLTANWALIIQTLVSTILPLLVGLVTKKVTRSGVKALLLAGLAIISSGLTELLAVETFDLGDWLVGAIGSFAVAVSAHYGLWKPLGASAALQAVGDKPEPPEIVTPA
jgi:hypothetical protein